MRGRWGTGGLVVALLATVLGAEAMAAEPKACAYAADIRALAPLLLPGPQQLSPRNSPDQVSDAAYLMLRYGGLTQAQEVALLASLPDTGSEGAIFDILRLIHGTREQRSAAIEAPVAEPDRRVRYITLASPSFVRDMILDGKTDRLIARLLDLQPKERGDARISEGIVRAVADFDDDAKLKLAKQVENAGLRAAPRWLVASMNDLSEWLAVTRKELRSDASPDLITKAYLDLGAYAMRKQGLDHLPPPLDTLSNNIGVRLNHLNYVLAGSYHGSYTLRRLISYTYDADTYTRGAEDLLKRIQNRTLSILDQDTLDLEMVRSMDRTVGRDKRERFLNAGHMPNTNGQIVPVEQTNPIYRGIARWALRAYVGGSTSNAPSTPPAELPTDFPWQTWLDTARHLREPAGDALYNPMIGAELLAAGGRGAEAAAQLQQILREAPSPEPIVDMAWRFLDDLAFRCGGEPQAHLPLERLYRFD